MTWGHLPGHTQRRSPDWGPGSKAGSEGGEGGGGAKQPEGSQPARGSPVLPRPVHVLVLLHALGVCSRHVDDVALGRRGREDITGASEMDKQDSLPGANSRAI